MEILTKEKFFALIDEETAKMPECYRRGQKVFNAVDAVFNVARVVQFHDGVDCFYDDNKIDEFKEKAYEAYKELEEHNNLHQSEFLKEDNTDDEDD